LGKSDYSRVPAELKALPNWVCWGWTEKPLKMPINPLTGCGAKAGQPETWGTFEQAYKHVELGTCKGVGFEFADGGGLVGVDLDHCRDKDSGEITTSLACEIIRSFHSYTEVSPSGSGIHIICRGRLPGPGLHRDKVEMYDSGRFFTVTGKQFSPGSLADAQAAIDHYYGMLTKRVKPAAAPQTSTGEGLQDEEVISRARKSRQAEAFERLWRGDFQGYPSQSEADLALCNMLAFWTGCNADQMDRLFRQSGLMRQKWDRKQAGTTYGAITVQNAVEHCPRTYTGHTTAERDFYGISIRNAAAEWKPAHQISPLSNFKRYTPDDIGAARLFADSYKGAAAYVPELKKFRVYDGKRWVDDTGDILIRQAAKAWSDYVRAAIPPADPKALKDKYAVYRKSYHKYRFLKNRKILIEDAQDELAHYLREFDRNPCLLNLKNGTFNLKTLKLQPHSPADMLSKIANVSYNPAAKCDRFEQFIYEVTEGKAERARMLQKAVGYAVAGNPCEECLFIATGLKTRNGKGTLFDTVLNILGDYGAQIDFNTLARGGARDGSRATPDLARLVGVRFALSSEPEKGTCFNEALLKQLTGGDEITARPLYGKPIQFKPAFTLFVETNSNPAVSDDSLFASDRIKLLPFTRHFSEQERDTGLKGQFRTEEAKSAILNWAIDGYKLYRAEGLQDTDEMRELVRAYRHDNDYISQFFEERFDFKAQGRTTLKSVRLDYARWCEDVGTKPLGLKLFKEELLKRNIRIVKMSTNQDALNGQFKPDMYLVNEMSTGG
jgi:putative DNA primase/helicase